MKQVPALATLHAILAFAAAAYFAFSKEASTIIPAVCYFGCSEILWRMAGASVLWEFGKYGVAVALLVWLARQGFRRPNPWPVVFVVLLLPSAVLTLVGNPEFGWVRRALSFNLSGPFALGVCAFAFSGVRLGPEALTRVLLSCLCPVVGAASICVFGLSQLDSDYEFGSESNFDASGGFGPNQVSSAFGFAILMAFLWVKRQRKFSVQWSVGVVLILWFAAQAALTFSRTGVWMGMLTIAVAVILQSRSIRTAAVSSAGFLLLVTLFFGLFQLLDNYTGGKLEQRFTEKGFSDRESIASGDLRIAMTHPLFGVGPGMVRSVRVKELGIGGMAHTEFTRVLAEHGVLGLLGLAALVWCGVQALLCAGSASQRVWAGTLLTYSAIFMMASGMRLVLPALAFGLAMLRFSQAPRRQGLAAMRTISASGSTLERVSGRDSA